MSDTGTSWNQDPSPPGTFQSAVGWDGYLACRYPAIEVDVTAPGCAPFHLSLPRSKPTGNGIVVEADLDCS